MKSFYRDKYVGVGTLVSSQERRAAAVPRLNQTFCSSTDLHRISFVHASEETFRTVVFDALEGKRVGRLLGEPTRRRPVLPRPVPPRPAPLCAAPPRPARGMSGFWVRQVVFVSSFYATHVWDLLCLYMKLISFENVFFVFAI